MSDHENDPGQPTSSLFAKTLLDASGVPKIETRELRMLEPLHDHLIVKLVSDKERTGGLYIPEVAKEALPYRFGRVAAVGPGLYSAIAGRTEPLPIHVGDIVVFGRGHGISIPVDDVEHTLIRYGEIFAVHERAPKPRPQWHHTGTAQCRHCRAEVTVTFGPGGPATLADHHMINSSGLVLACAGSGAAP